MAFGTWNCLCERITEFHCRPRNPRNVRKLAANTHTLPQLTKPYIQHIQLTYFWVSFTAFHSSVFIALSTNRPKLASCCDTNCETIGLNTWANFGKAYKNINTVNQKYCNWVLTLSLLVSRNMEYNRSRLFCKLDTSAFMVATLWQLTVSANINCVCCGGLTCLCVRMCVCCVVCLYLPAEHSIDLCCTGEQ